MQTGSLTIFANFTLDGVVMAPRVTYDVNFDGGRIQSTPIISGTMTDSHDQYLGAGLNVATLAWVTNNTGWTVDLAYSFNAAFTSLPPGGTAVLVCPGDAGHLDNITTPLDGLTYLLTSAEGTDGTIDAFVLGVV